MTTVVLTTTGANNWSVPADFNPTNNSVICVGAGARGEHKADSGVGANPRGGGGGACSVKNNVNLTPSSSVPYNIGVAGQGSTPDVTKDGGDTWFGHASFASALCAAKGGTIPTGGQAASGIGDSKFSGGDGSAGTSGGGGGGGGAAGPNGAGQNGTAGSGNTGGHGGRANGGLGADGGAGGPDRQDGDDGQDGTEYGASKGFGGGGGGGSGGQAFGDTDYEGGDGGDWGGGGGGAGGEFGTFGLGGPGANGVIIITYEPNNPSTLTVTGVL